jgi:subtilisin-like proprotein convertase family protein
MRDLLHSVVAILVLAGPAVADLPSKVAYPKPVDAGLIGEDPYRFNGVVVSELGRGSGFCAWNSKTFFSAAHVVCEEGKWALPPLWYGAVHADTLDPEAEVPSRGYFRWNAYSKLLALNGAEHPKTYGKDVILAYALTNLVEGSPAEIDFKGFKNLRGVNPVMITGYPAIIDYTQESNSYFMHQTGPVTLKFYNEASDHMATTLISTGPGNSGGPVWSQTGGNPWRAAGVLVSGLPGEAGVYAFSGDVKALTRSVTPVIRDIPTKPVTVAGVDRSSFVFPMTKPKRIPDGVAKWTSFGFNVSKFPEEAKVTKVLISLDIDTTHRGDLVVWLQGPEGSVAQLALEEGGSEQDLVIVDKDVSSFFEGLLANGRWSLRVQDRLKGDIATVNRILLEIGCD